MTKTTTDLNKIFKALSNENRVRILLFIHKQGCRCESTPGGCLKGTSVKDLSKVLKLSTPTISHHLKELINAGLIITSKEGRWLYCKLNNKTFKETGGFLNEFFTNKGRRLNK